MQITAQPTALLFSLVLLLAGGCGSGDSQGPGGTPVISIDAPAADEVLAGTFSLAFTARGATELIWSFDGVRAGGLRAAAFAGEVDAAELGGGMHLLEVTAVGLRDTTRAERWIQVASVLPPGGGHPAPGFFATDLDGAPISPDDLRSGHVTMLNFWASWCSPCRQEMPALQELHETYASQGLRLIGMDIQESRATCEAVVAELGLTYPMALDSTTIVSHDFYGVGAIPTTLLIDGRGEIRTKFVGSEEYEVFRAALEPLLAELPAP